MNRNQFYGKKKRYRFFPAKHGDEHVALWFALVSPGRPHSDDWRNRKKQNPFEVCKTGAQGDTTNFRCNALKITFLKQKKDSSSQ